MKTLSAIKRPILYSFEKTYDVLGPSDEQINIGSPKIRITDQLPTLPITMFDDMKNCLLGKDAAVLRFHHDCTYEVGEVVLYQPLDEGHPTGVWYQAKISRIRDTGYMELEPVINHYTVPDSSALV